MNPMAYLWLALMVVFLIAEGVCPYHLVSIWFAVGALAATLVAVLDGSVAIQVAVFLALSCILLAALWPLTKKILYPQRKATNLDAIIGSIGLVTADIDNLAATGQVKLGGIEWTARSSSGNPIPRGSRIRVDRIEGVKVFVSPAEVSANL